MWWKSAVNLSFFLSLATFRMRSSACDTLTRLCARHVLCWPHFPWSPPWAPLAGCTVSRGDFAHPTVLPLCPRNNSCGSCRDITTAHQASCPIGCAERARTAPAMPTQPRCRIFRPRLDQTPSCQRERARSRACELRSRTSSVKTATALLAMTASSRKNPSSAMFSGSVM
jgi:hypothetical protein